MELVRHGRKYPNSSVHQRCKRKRGHRYPLYGGRCAGAFILLSDRGINGRLLRLGHHHLRTQRRLRPLLHTLHLPRIHRHLSILPRIRPRTHLQSAMVLQDDL